jgi:hypothetical protein
MVSRILPDALARPGHPSTQPAAQAAAVNVVASTSQHRYWHAVDNAKRCRRLARYMAGDARLCLDLEQLAADYESLAARLRRH